jgi:predicted RNA methylase
LEQILAVDLAAGQGVVVVVAVAAAAAVVAVVPEACYSQKPKPCFA